ncbi:MAG: hypothetical protein ACREXR_00400 [Gammaproteobacteria bacterium]
MAQKSRATLKALFEDGDLPDAAAYGDLIDSAVNLIDTTAQSFGFPLTVSAAFAINVCAERVYANTAVVSALRLLQKVSAQRIVTSALRHRAPHAYMALKTPTTYGGSVSPIKVSAPTTAAATDLLGFTHTSPNRLTYIGKPATMLVQYSLTIGGTTANEKVLSFIAKNGVVETKSIVQARTSSGTFTMYENALPLIMVANDYVEVYTATTATALGLNVHGLGLSIHPISWIF